MNLAEFEMATGSYGANWRIDKNGLAQGIFVYWTDLNTIYQFGYNTDDEICGEHVDFSFSDSEWKEWAFFINGEPHGEELVWGHDGEFWSHTLHTNGKINAEDASKITPQQKETLKQEGYFFYERDEMPSNTDRQIHVRLPDGNTAYQTHKLGSNDLHGEHKMIDSNGNVVWHYLYINNELYQENPQLTPEEKSFLILQHDIKFLD